MGDPTVGLVPDFPGYAQPMPESSLIDISPILSPQTSVFPGDTALSREVLLDMTRGDPLTLSTLRGTVHIGSHADAPSHYGLRGQTIEAMPLEHYLGPCQVMDVRATPNQPIQPDDLLGEIGERRVLLRTLTQPDKRVFNKDFAWLSGDLIEHLSRSGVITIGVDTPSVDAADSKDLPAHRAILRAGIAIIEGLVLDAAPAGRYELVALPLRLEGFDASPVRAVLRRP